MARKRDGLLTRPQLAEALGVTAGTITRWERDGMPVARRLSRGKSTLFDQAAVEAWRAATEAEQAGSLSLAEERAKLAKKQGEKLDLELSVRRGELVEVEAVIQANQATVKGWSAKVRGLPRRMVNAGVITASQEAAAAKVCRELLDEIAAWKTVADMEQSIADEEPVAS